MINVLYSFGDLNDLLLKRIKCIFFSFLDRDAYQFSFKQIEKRKTFTYQGSRQEEKD